MSPTRVVALIDGEHYPPVVRFALDRLRETYDIAGAVFIGGTEKVDAQGADVYGVPLIAEPLAEDGMRTAIERFAPDEFVDLSDEPIVSSRTRFRLASVALAHGVGYRGADFSFEPPGEYLVTATPTLAIVGTGKRVGKTSVSAHVARRLKSTGHDVAVLAMGRGGPAEPELIRGEQIELATEDLLRLAREGKHASSDNYEDAVMSRVTTVGCRRCGGGMAGRTFFSNVVEGARLADGLGKQLIVLEGSGAALPPVAADATMVVVGAGRGTGYVTDFFGPFRLAFADVVVIAGAEEPLASRHEVEEIRAAILRERPGVELAAVVFRPRPIAPVEGRRVLFATTAPTQILDRLREHLEAEAGCEVVAVSPHLSNRALLREDLARHAGSFDVLLTELKAAAIDVVAAEGERVGVDTVLCDNVPLAVDGADFDAMISTVAETALERGKARHEVTT